MKYNHEMGKRQFQLTEKEVKEFRQAEQQTRDIRELKRLQAVRMYGSGKAIELIVDMHNSGESSIREWVHKYQRDGLAGLRSKWSGQNANKLDETQRAQLKQRLEEYRPDQILPPDMRISAGRFWTVSDLQIAVEQWYGVVYKDEGSYRNLLHRSGFSYQRVERVYKSRPSEVKVAEYEAELEKK